LKTGAIQLTDFKRLFPLAIALCAAGSAMLMQGCGSGEGSKFVASKSDSLPEVVDYNIHIRPIMSDKCFNCHGPDANKREAGLRLDTPEGAYAGLGENKDHYAIVSGNIDKSEVFKRISTADEKLLMPVPKSNLPKLTSLEIAMIAKWIDQGAEYKPLWSTIVPKEYKVPIVKNEKWAVNEIDNFVLAKLDREGLKPSSEAEKERLIRRVTFDLNGLPPTLAEIDNFLKDNSPKAYEKVIDRLLASPRYGEKMAADWMDVSRYADSHGYQDDGYRNTWHWRDWVIKAFNENLPYDKFVTWQLAGDLLPNPTKEQILATGFNRNHAQNQEGGIIDEEFRVEYALERTGTTAKAFLGLTMECARCHDHKYDPITQKEFYQFSAFFNQNAEPGEIPNYGVPGATMLLSDQETDEKIDFMKNKIAIQAKQLSRISQKTKTDFEQWFNKNKSMGIINAHTKNMISYYNMNKIVKQTRLDDKKKKVTDLVITNSGENLKSNMGVSGSSVLVPGIEGQALEVNSDGNFAWDEPEFDNHDPFTYSLWIKPSVNKNGMMLLNKKRVVFDGYIGHDLIINSDTTLSVRLIYAWPFDMIKVTSLKKLKVGSWNHIAFTYDGSSKAAGVKMYLDGNPVSLFVCEDNLIKSINTSTNYYDDKIKIERFVHKKGQKVPLILGSEMFNDVIPRLEKCAVDELKLFNTNLTSTEIKWLVDSTYLAALAKKEIKQFTKAEYMDLEMIYLRNFNKEFRTAFDSLTATRSNLLETLLPIEEVMVMQDKKVKRKTFILNRGVYDAPTDSVEMGTPKSILPFSKDLPQNRLGLAQWLIDPKNPLPSRVIVNRYWQSYFGTGLVSSSGDFGNQGALPSHPELLDWLSLDFIKSGWDIKAMQKKMVMSSTYKQSSKMTPEIYAKDPQNLLLARGPRYRFPFEMIRDNALAISGVLNDTIGGESVYPYQPKGLWEEKTSGRHLTTYIQSHGTDLYKRSLYSFFKRTSPPPAALTFDASDRAYCTVKKSVTNTPLQALVNMNDPQLLEASRVLAEKIMLEGGNTIEGKIAYAFRLATARKISDKETKILKGLYEKELARFKKDSKTTAAYLNIGEYAINRNLNPYEIAAYAVVINTILNLDETINKS
jgi:hypothetical protein